MHFSNQLIYLFQVLIDGPLTRVPRQQYPVSHLHLTKFVVKFPFTAPTRIVKKALEDYKLKDKWSQTLWAERAKAKRLVRNIHILLDTETNIILSF